MSMAPKTVHVAVAGLLATVLLTAGCLVDQVPGSQGPGPGEGNDNITTEPAGDVHLEAIEVPGHVVGDTNATWHVRVQHRGDEDSPPFAYKGGCETSWKIEVADADGNVLDRNGPSDHANCMGFTTHPMAPGDSFDANITWDGRHYDHDAKRFVVTPGDHTLTVVFMDVHSDNEGGGPRLTHGFQVV